MSFMYVKVIYGPCKTFHTLAHKPQKLRGLRCQLQRLGYRVDLIPIQYVDICILELCGHMVFHCNINNLLFNMPAQRDPVTLNAVDAVLEATAKIMRARTYLWMWMVIEDSTFKRSENAPKDYWQFDADIKPFMDLKCIDCCKILVDRLTAAPHSESEVDTAINLVDIDYLEDKELKETQK